eukprot:7814687-Alexandrium_andersonii.AAC.1
MGGLLGAASAGAASSSAPSAGPRTPGSALRMSSASAVMAFICSRLSCPTPKHGFHNQRCF